MIISRYIKVTILYLENLGNVNVHMIMEDSSLPSSFLPGGQHNLPFSYIQIAILFLLTPKQYSMKWMIAICMLVVSIIIHYNGHYDYDIDDYYSFFLAQTDPSGFAQRVWHHRGHLPGDRDLVVSGVPFHPGLMSDLIKKNLSTSHL